MLLVMAEAYAKRSGPERRMSVLLGEEDREKLARFYADEYRQKLEKGVDIRLGRDIEKGFRVSMNGDHVEHDFSARGHRLGPLRDVATGAGETHHRRHGR